MKLKQITALLLAILLISGGVFAQENTEVATVNDNSINEKQLEQFAQTQQLIMQISQVNRDFAQLLFSTEDGQKLMNEYKKIKLDELINQELLKQKAIKSDVELTKEEKEKYFYEKVKQIKSQNNLTQKEFEELLKKKGISSVEEYKKQFLNNSNLIVDKFLRTKVLNDISITDKRAKEYYENNKSRFKQQKQVDVSHILLEDKSKAEDIKQRLKNGAKFEQLAKDNSIDKNSAKNGGNLGYIKKGQLIEKFDNIAFNLNKGEISDIVETQYGYHIIKINDKKQEKVLSFEEVKDKIKSNLLQNKKQQELKQYISNLRDQSKINIKI